MIMTTEKEISDTLKDLHVDWEATPQSVMGPASVVITSQEDFEAYKQRDRDLIGYGYFYVDVRNMTADLALMYSTRPGRWETMIIPPRDSPLLEEDLIRSIEEAGGTLGWSGHYPLDPLSLAKVRASYLGDGDTNYFVES
jgi:hypothetical protein